MAGAGVGAAEFEFEEDFLLVVASELATKRNWRS